MKQCYEYFSVRVGRISLQVVEEIVKGVKYKVIGKLVDPDTNATNAQCTAMIANIGAIPQARKDRYGE